jgi:predicted RNA-binding protein with PUA domain
MKLQNIISEIYQEDSEKTKKLELTSPAQQRSVSNIYQQVIIDEINEKLMNSVQQTDAPVVILLLREERQKSFGEMWRTANLDFYNT